MNNEVISVIVPIYNVATYLPFCIQSILGQSYPHLEVLLVDDGSTDGSGEICDQFARDARVRVIHKKNSGSADARNVGLDAASGDYVIFVDSDDYIAPTMMEKLHDAMPNAGLAMCGFGCVGERAFALDAPFTERQSLPNGVITEQSFWQGYFAHPGALQIVIWNKLVRREHYNGVRFASGRRIDDEFVIHHLIANAQTIACVDETLYFYRKRAQSAMSSKFSIGHLDVVEARLQRATFFHQRNMQLFAEKSATFAFSELVYGKQQLDFADPKTKPRYHQLRKMGKQLAKPIFNSSKSMKFRVAYAAFASGDRAYHALMQIQTKRK